MTVCPACGHDSETIYRCEACGHDLVDVDAESHDDDSDDRPIAVFDGGHPPGVAASEHHPESENERVGRAVREATQLVEAGDEVSVAVTYVADEFDLKHRAREIYQRVREEVDDDE